MLLRVLQLPPLAPAHWHDTVCRLANAQVADFVSLHHALFAATVTVQLLHLGTEGTDEDLVANRSGTC